MDKLPVVIVALDPNRIEEVLSNLNFKAAAVIAMIVDRGDQRSIEAGDIAIPTYPLTSIEDFLVRKTDFIWLLHGNRTDQMKQFLIENGIAEDFIVEFNVRLDGRWLESVKAIGGKNFFVTGDRHSQRHRSQMFRQRRRCLSCRRQSGFAAEFFHRAIFFRSGASGKVCVDRSEPAIVVCRERRQCSIRFGAEKFQGSKRPRAIARKVFDPEFQSDQRK